MCKISHIQDMLILDKANKTKDKYVMNNANQTGYRCNE